MVALSSKALSGQNCQKFSRSAGGRTSIIQQDTGNGGLPGRRPKSPAPRGTACTGHGSLHDLGSEISCSMPGGSGQERRHKREKVGGQVSQAAKAAGLGGQHRLGEVADRGGSSPAGWLPSGGVQPTRPGTVGGVSIPTGVQKPISSPPPTGYIVILPCRRNTMPQVSANSSSNSRPLWM